MTTENNWPSISYFCKDKEEDIYHLQAEVLKVNWGLCPQSSWPAAPHRIWTIKCHLIEQDECSTEMTHGFIIIKITLHSTPYTEHCIIHHKHCSGKCAQYNVHKDFVKWLHLYTDCRFVVKKSRIRETKNLSTDADRRTDTILERLRDFP